MSAPTLQFKRGLLANLPGLRAGEPGFTTDSYELYVGIDSSINNNKFFGSHRYWTKGTASTGSGVNFVEGTNNGSQYITLKAADTLAGITTFTLPSADGSPGQVLSTNGSGILSFSTLAASSFTISDGTSTDSVGLGETLTFAGTANEIETAVTGNQVQIGLPDAVSVTTSLVVGSGVTINASGINAAAGIVTASRFVSNLEFGTAPISVASSTRVDNLNAQYVGGFGAPTSQVIGATDTQTLTNKTIALGSNTISGTLAQFNTALTDADFVSIAGTETLTNKTLTSPTLTSPSLGVATATSIVVGSGVTINATGIVASAGIITASSFKGSLTGTASSATQLVTPRTISLSNDLSGSVTFDGSSDVTISATIQADSVDLGTDTTGDYVESITGTANQITVSEISGEGSTPTLSIPNQFTVPQDLTVTRDVQINRNLNVDGNLTIGGTTAFIDVQRLQVSDADLILGFRTDAFGNDASNDTTANHGGVAVASTEGTPLVNLSVAGIETVPATYKKIMWFKSGTFAGLGTDAWLSNYAIGIGSTQFPTGTRLAAGNVQFTENDLAAVRHINSTGIITAARFSGGTISGTSLNISTGISTLGFVTASSAYVSGVTTSNGVNLTTGTEYKIDGTSVLSNNTLGSNVVNSSLTSVGTLGKLNVTGVTTSGGVNLTIGNDYKINDTLVLNSTTLGSGVVNSSLTSVGTLNQLNVSSSGITTVGFITATNAYVSGVTTSNGVNLTTGTEYKINGTSVLSNDTLGSGVTASSLTSVGALGQLQVGTGITISAFSNAAIVGTGNSTTTIPTVSAVKNYVDSVDLTISLAADGGTTGSVATSETLTVSGTANEVNTSVSGQTITVGLPDSVTVTTALTTPTVNATNLKANDGTTAITLSAVTGNVGINSDLTVTGNLVVNGTTTQVNTASMTVEDRTIELGIVNGAAPGTDTTWDLGVLFNYHATTAKKSGVIWEQESNRFKFAKELTDSGNDGVSNPQISFVEYSPIEIASLWVNNACTGGPTEVISCFGGPQLEIRNVVIDAGTF